MTTFAAWIGVDPRGPGSIYLASDSRISWGTALNWDRGRKVFASSNHPDILGYIGDVLFPSLALAQVTSAIDAGVMYSIVASPAERFKQIESSVKASFTLYPKNQRQPFAIIYATREGEFSNSVFHLYILSWNPLVGWKGAEMPMPDKSSTLCILGSGGTALSEWQTRWESSTESGTSRAVFSAFCDALYSDQDPRTGGAPQLVGVYRKGSGRVFGVIYDENPFLFGMRLEKDVASASSDLQWRNRFFERCDAQGRLIQGAKKHRVPESLGITGQE